MGYGPENGVNIEHRSEDFVRPENGVNIEHRTSNGRIRLCD